MEQTRYDVFISYKRKSLPTANNLYYRLTTRGYSTFFDLEEMGRDNINVQLLNFIENAKDVFVILEEGSLDACKQENWEKDDWFCHEIAFALEKKKNIIPILLNGYKMPSEDFFPEKLKELSLKHAPEFNFSFFEAYLDKLIEKDYLISKPNIQDKATSTFKFYSNEDCKVFKEGKLVCSLEGMSDEPYYLPVSRKGDYSFKVVNSNNSDKQNIEEYIEADSEKMVFINWQDHLSIQSGTQFKKLKYLFFLVILFFSVVVCVLSYLLLEDYNHSNSRTNDISRPLFVVGGSSVYNFIRDKFKVYDGTDSISFDIRKQHNIIFFNLASGLSQELLFEELGKSRELGDSSLTDFSTICISATKMDPNHKTLLTYHQAKGSCIVEHFIGFDTLAIFLTNRLSEFWGYNHDSLTIQVNALRRFIDSNRSTIYVNNQWHFNLYTTSEKSGTLKTYNSALYGTDTLDFQNYATYHLNDKYPRNNVYREQDSYDAIKTKDADSLYLILGSSCFFPETLKSKLGDECKKMYVKQGGNYILKEMYIYFVAPAEGTSKCRIRPNILWFLNQIGVNTVNKELFTQPKGPIYNLDKSY